MIDHDPDFWPTMEEAEQLAKDAAIFWELERKKRAELYSTFQDYEEVFFMCDKCKFSFHGNEAISDNESQLVTALRCPKCDFKLLTLQNEATVGELQKLAKAGHKNAKMALE